MRTQTQVTIYINTLTVTQNLVIDPNGFVLKIFMACSGAESRVFKARTTVIKINQTLKIRNIQAKQLQFWLCTSYNKITAVGSINLGSEDGAFSVQLKMMNTDFGKLEGNLQIRNYEIEKKVYIEPDEQLLKKVEDPIQKKRKQEQQTKKAKQAAEAIEAAKNVKKPAVTLTRFNKKDQPFI